MNYTVKQLKIVQAFFPYYGAKAKLAPVIDKLIPHKDIIRSIDAFGGAGNITLQKTHHPIEIYNELDYDISNVFYCMADRDLSSQLIAEMVKVPFTHDAFNNALAILKKLESENIILENRIHQAVLTLTVLLQTFNGIVGPGYKLAKWKGLYDSRYNLRYLKKLLNMRNVQDRMQGVQVMNRDALDVINEFRDDPETFIYSDSPYTGPERAAGANVYKIDNKKDDKKIKRKVKTKEDTENKKGFDQVKYLRTIVDIKKCKIIVSGYQSKLYDDTLVKEGGWYSYILGTVKKTCQIRQKGEVKDLVDEIIWTNFKL